MDKKGVGGKLAALGLLAVFVIYIGLQVAINLRDRIETQDAAVVTVEDKLQGEGVFFREQTVLDPISGKNAEYLVANGEKVSREQQVAMFFDDAESIAAYRAYKNAVKEEESLKYAYTHLAGGSDSGKIDSLMFLSMVDLTEELSTGLISAAEQDYADLAQLLVRRDGSKMTEEEYNAASAKLRAEQQSLLQSIKGRSSVVGAPVPGYFVRGCDGFENRLSPATMADITPSLVHEALEAEGAADDGVGSVITGFAWYFAAVFDADEAVALRGQKSAYIRFPQIGNDTLRVSVVGVQHEQDGEAVVLFKSTKMDPVFLQSRQQTVELVRETFSGIKVPREALRQVDGKWGVYCLVGAISRFKPIEWTYQTDSYYLATPAISAAKGLYLYDKIIVRGKDLETGKVVN